MRALFRSVAQADVGRALSTRCLRFAIFLAARQTPRRQIHLWQKSLRHRPDAGMNKIAAPDRQVIHHRRDNAIGDDITNRASPFSYWLTEPAPPRRLRLVSRTSAFRSGERASKQGESSASIPSVSLAKSERLRLHAVREPQAGRLDATGIFPPRTANWRTGIY